MNGCKREMSHDKELIEYANKLQSIKAILRKRDEWQLTLNDTAEEIYKLFNRKEFPIE